MKITEIITESQQINEGPLGSAAGAVARGAGKVIGGVAKGVGALAGIPGGVKKAFQKGKQAATDFIGGKDEPADSGAAQPAAEPAAAQGGAAPAQQPAQKPQGFVQGFKQGLTGKSQEPTTTSAINKQGPTGTAPARVAGGAQQQAIAKTAQAAGGDVEKANQTVYAQVKAQINNLDKKGKQRILQLLQKSIQQTPAQPAAASAQAAPATGPGSQTVPATPGAPARTEPDLNAPEQKPAAAGKKPATPKKKVAPSQAEIDADRNRLIGQTSDSVIRTGKVVAESFTFYRR